MRYRFINCFLFLLYGFNHLIAQGIGFPDEPSQAPIGGLGLLAFLGAYLANKKLNKRK